MGLTRVNNRPIVTTKDLMTVEELKKVAGISELERLYALDTGRVLTDAELIDTREAEYGATAAWERGVNSR